MPLGDILFDRDVATKKLTAAFATVYDVSMDSILVVDDIAEATFAGHITERTRIVCERTLVEGDFRLLVAVYIRDSDVNQSDDIKTAGQLATKLQAACLIFDDTNNPYRWLLVEGKGKVRPVFLDPKYLDAEDQPTYVLAK